MTEELTIKVHKGRIYGKDDTKGEWGIKSPTDYREPDYVYPLNELRIITKDANFNAHIGSAGEPDWFAGWAAQDNRTGGYVFEGVGEPPEWVKRAFLESRVIFGYIVIRDLAMHNV